MASGTIYGSTNNKYISCRVDWTSTSNGSTANTSTVTAKLYYWRNNAGYTTKGTISGKLTIAGNSFSYSKEAVLTYNSNTLLATHTFTVTHNNDGTKSITISATGGTTGTSLESTSLSGTAKLDNIPRYTSISGYGVTVRNETSVKVAYTSSATCDKARYCLNDSATWTDIPSDNIITGLKANTTYKVKISLRRKDSQLWTTTENKSITTYAYPTHSIDKVNETSLKVTWSCNEKSNHIWYKLNDGENWVDKGNPNAKTGSFTVSGLSANTTYKIQVAVQREATGLWTSTGNKSQTTYDYPKPTAITDFTIGDSTTITVSNPLKRSYTLKLISKVNNSEIGSYSGNVNGNISGFNDAGSVSKQYATIPSAKSGKYYAKVTYGSVTKTSGEATYKTKDSDCTPSIDSTKISYYDGVASVVNITGNKQHIVRNKSDLHIKRVDGYATAKKSASITKCEFTFNGVTKTDADSNFGKVNLSSDAKFIVKVTDSRGYTNSIEKTVTILNWQSPTMNIRGDRLNNYEDETTFQAVVSFYSVNNKNAVTGITVQYKKEGASSYTNSFNLTNNVANTISLDKLSVYNIRATCTDKFGSYTVEFKIPRGTPILFVDTKKLSVGVNCFPSNDESFEVEGKMRLNSNGVVTSNVVNGKTLEEIIKVMTKSNGMMGSFYLKTAKSPMNVGWYSFVYMPHRFGEVYADNNQNGTLLCTRMTVEDASLYLVHYFSGAVKTPIKIT